MLMSCATYAEGPTQEKYRSHRVQSGETVYSLSKKYNVSERTIYKLNPDAKKGIAEGSIIILPSEDIINSGSTSVEFKKHKVRRKETLFSISQKYNVSVDDIKKYNKHLYAKGLKKGEKLQIPILKNGGITGATSENGTGSENSDHSTHIIKAKETKYGIARLYGISVAELETLNPSVPGNFPIGTELKVPKQKVTETATIEETAYDFYEVQPKEGFYRLKIKLGLTQEQIVDLNPYAKDGLKDGMILKVPKGVSGSLSADVTTVDLQNSITNTEAKRIAVLLPFQLKKVKSSQESNEELIKNNRTMRVALDFYSGVLMAGEFAKEKGLSINLDVYDTEGSDATISSLISNNNFSDLDAVIGPLLSKNVEKTAAMLKSDNVPVFSPLSNRNIKLTSNLFQTLPSDDFLQAGMIEYLRANASDKSVLLISDKTKTKEKAAIMAALPNAVALSPREKGFLYVVDIQNKMKDGIENWVILESKDPVIISNVVGLLNGMPENFKIRLFTTDKNDNYEFDDISNMHLAHLNFTFPSVSKSYNYKDKSAFVVSYKNKHGVYPNRFAVRGFDVAYDVILRMAAEGNVYDASDSDFETEYIENKFRYKKKMFSGYMNNAMYILKYNEDLRFEVVK